MRLLDGRKIPYVTHTFSPTSTCRWWPRPWAATEQVFKTLVVLLRRPPQPYLATPGNRELDLKKYPGDRRETACQQREAESLTALVGGISALALLNKGLVVLDASAQGADTIPVSAGQRGINLQLAVSDPIKVTNARVADLSA